MKLAKSAFLPQEQKEFWTKGHHCNNYEDLSSVISEFCSMQNKPVILMIDEVDKSTDNQLFLSFLGMLRINISTGKRKA